MSKQIFQKDYWEREGLTKRRPPEHPVIRAYVLSKIRHLRPYINLTPSTRLLDVGCGNGFFTYYFAQICDTYGVDYSQKLLEMNPIKKTFLMDANHLEFADNSFDVVFCHALLHHVKDMDRVIKEMQRVSKKYVIILEPNRTNPLMFVYSLLVKEERQIVKFSLSYLKNKAEQQGLKIIAAFSEGLTLPNKTPTYLAFLVKYFSFKQPWGVTNFVISQKQ